MANRRTEIMAFTGTLATLGLAAAALIAAVGKQPVSSPWFILSTVVGVASAVAFAAAGLSALPGWVRPMLDPLRPPARLVVDRWLYTTEGFKAPAVTVAMEIGLPGTSTRLPGERPPWVRFVVTMACSEISADDDPEMHYEILEGLITNPLVHSMIRELTFVPDPTVFPQWPYWQRRSTNRLGVIDEVLVTDRQQPLAMASAHLELPTGGQPPWGRDGRCATIILHIEPRDQDGSPAAPKPPDFWETLIPQALMLPKVLAEQLAVAGLRTSGEPPAQVGVRLQAARDLAEIVDPAGMDDPIEGETRATQAIGFFIADRQGKPADHAAGTMVCDMLLHALNCDPRVITVRSLGIGYYE